MLLIHTAPLIGSCKSSCAVSLETDRSTIVGEEAELRHVANGVSGTSGSDSEQIYSTPKCVLELFYRQYYKTVSLFGTSGVPLNLL